MKEKITRKTEQQEILESCKDEKEYYHKVLSAKNNGQPWAADIPLDMAIIRAEQSKCMHCGNPINDGVYPYECKRCSINRLIHVYGFTKEAAEKEIADREELKEAGIKFLEMLKNKRTGNYIREEELIEVEDMPF